MLKLVITYPSRDEERLILQRMTGEALPPVQPVVTPAQILHAREVTRGIYVDEKIQDYVLDLVFASREPEKYGLGDLCPLIDFGVSPRATIYLIQAAKAHAFLQGRGYVIPEDIKQIAVDVMQHRVIVTYEAEAEDVTATDVVQQILDHVEVP